MNIEEICKKYSITDYSINADGSIDVNENVDLRGESLKQLPLKFNKVSGTFFCNLNQLTTLEGAPKSVGGNFFCDKNRLTTLERAPKSVGGSFLCINNQLTTLEGAPTSVGGDFYCYDNPLTTLEGAPKSVLGNFYSEYFSSLCKKSSIITQSFLLSTDWAIRKYPGEMEEIKRRMIEHAMNL